MDEISVKDYRIYNLQKDYNKYANLMYNLQQHIEHSFKEYLININERNNYLKLLNDFLRKMNTTYNYNMLEICGASTETEDESDIKSKDKKISLSKLFPSVNLINIGSNNIFEDIRNLISIYKLLNIELKQTDKSCKIFIEQIINDPFIEINNDINEQITKKIGFKDINDGLIILLGEKYEKLFDKEMLNLIHFYNKIYIPISYEVVEKIPNSEINNDNIILNKINLDNEVILDNAAEIYIECMNFKNRKEIAYIKFIGYFNIDSLNIFLRTSQICMNIVYQKKKNIENHIVKSSIDDKFARAYLRNVNISDFLSMNEKEFIHQLDSDYELFSRLTKLTFINVMKEFIREDNDKKLNIKHMYRIIKLLLLGSDDNINVAGLLFGISKEKKPGIDSPISDIIYKNLSYLSQIKLRKTAISIKNELEKIKSLTVDDIDLKKQVVICKNMPDSIKKLCVEKIDEMKSSNNEYYKQLMYVKTLLNYPFPSSDDDAYFLNLKKDSNKSKEFLESVVSKLNEKVYGHDDCKQSIKEEIAKWISNPSCSGSAIGLVGPPGVGKTLIAKAIGKALGIPFVQITLGGQNDGELLHGHGYTYSGAQPGLVVKKMVEAGNARCIMYFDELDKACKKHDSNEIFNILIHMTDPNSNKEFTDRFFQEVKFPLNKVLFIFSYNHSELIDNILLDRINEKEVKPFNLKDKKVIFKNYLMTEVSDMVGFEKESIIIEDDDIEFIIENYTNEPGVRDLKRKIEKLFMKLNVDRIYKINLFEKVNNPSKSKPIKLTRELITEFLGKNNLHIQYIHDEDQVGVVNGLYATELGKGGVLPIQVYNNYTGSDDKFTLKLTGSQKRVMRESVISAFTSALHIIKEDIRDKFIELNPYGFHIHTPSGAIPKDGPSAGVAFATAFASRILNKKIKNNIGMTGEIELTGKITKIGGLQYKLTGAKKAGVKLVLVSKENHDDIEKIKVEYKELFVDNFEVKLVDNLQEVLENALVDFDKNQLKY